MVRSFLAVAVASVLVLATPRPGSAQTITGYGGDAFGVQVSIPALGINTTRTDTGLLGPGPGSLSNGDGPFIINPGVVFQTTGVSTATSGSGPSEQSQALVIQPNIFTGYLTATQALSQTQATASGVFGASVVTNLFFEGNPIFVTGAPNQTVFGTIGKLIINEQFDDSVAGHNELTVNALDLTITAGGFAGSEFFVGHSNSSVNFTTSVPEPGSVTLAVTALVPFAGLAARRVRRRRSK